MLELFDGRATRARPVLVDGRRVFDRHAKQATSFMVRGVRIGSSQSLWAAGRHNTGRVPVPIDKMACSQGRLDRERERNQFIAVDALRACISAVLYS